MKPFVADLYARAARALGWSPADVHSISIQTLRDLVRPVDPDLAQEIALSIQSGAYIHEAPSSKAPTKPARAPKKAAKDIEGAVYAAQLYIGKGLTMRITDEQKLYKSMHRKIASVAKRLGMDEADAYRQITAEAKRRGGLLALPGKDI
jgi:CO/xanthine dehydrogenase Mo-binding subunit